jgi:hypothetical protein
MNVSNIIYYHLDVETDKRTTISLRELSLREGFELESIFTAVKDATDAEDLLNRIRVIIHEPSEMDCENVSYIRFKVWDVYGTLNYLKFKKKKEK